MEVLARGAAAALFCFSRSARPTSSSSDCKPERGESRAHLLGDEGKVVDDVVGRSGEARAELLALGGDSHGAVVGVADAGHDAAG